jgi:hypothetical protein
MKTKKRYWKTLVAIFVGLLFFIFLIYIAGSISSGSYGYAQQYKFMVKKSKLIEAVERFKNENKSYNPPSIYGTHDTLDVNTSNFIAYVFYPDQNSIVCFFVDSHDANVSYINLVSINEGLETPIFKRVNKDFDRNDNLKIKEDFKDKILNKLGFAYKDKGNGMFIFWK